MKIDYNDLTYIDKRGILRKHYLYDNTAFTIVKKLTILVRREILNLKHPIFNKLFDCDIITDFLIDGYLAFELIDNDYYSKIDPSTLQLSTIDKNKFIWEQYINGEIYKKIDYDKIIYISYSKYETSFLETIYKGLIDVNDDVFISEHVDIIIEALTTNSVNIEKVLHINFNIIRSIKIKKIKKLKK